MHDLYVIVLKTIWKIFFYISGHFLPKHFGPKGIVAKNAKKRVEFVQILPKSVPTGAKHVLGKYFGWFINNSTESKSHLFFFHFRPFPAKTFWFEQNSWKLGTFFSNVCLCVHIMSRPKILGSEISFWTYLFPEKKLSS